MFEKIRKWFKSRTIWFSTFGVPAIMGFLNYAQENLPLVQENLGASYGLTSFIIGGAIFWLRTVTIEPLSEK